MADGPVTTVTGFRTARVEVAGRPLTLVSIDGQQVTDVDEVVVVTGFRPDHSWLSEVHLDLDGELSAPVALAPEIHPAYHSCGSVTPHGANLLRQPEGDLYLVGMKSYGRAPSFLTMTGYEQVRSVVAEIAGDHEAAARVELVLPETGVCGGSGLFDEQARRRWLLRSGRCRGSSAHHHRCPPGRVTLGTSYESRPRRHDSYDVLAQVRGHSPVSAVDAARGGSRRGRCGARTPRSCAGRSTAGCSPRRATSRRGSRPDTAARDRATLAW